MCEAAVAKATNQARQQWAIQLGNSRLVFCQEPHICDLVHPGLTAPNVCLRPDDHIYIPKTESWVGSMFLRHLSSPSNLLPDSNDKVVSGFPKGTSLIPQIIDEGGLDLQCVSP